MKRSSRPAAGAASSPAIALSLGSNTERPEHRLRLALAGLREHLAEARIAPLYRSRPVSALVQPDFLNTVVIGRTRLEPDELLAVAKALEWRVGRRRGPRNGPRPLDIDLLLWGDLRQRDPALTLPHPRLALRRFYLAPLADLAPGLTVPGEGTTVAALLAGLGNSQAVVRIEWSAPPPEAW